MIKCPHCSKWNDPDRGSDLCWSCRKPLKGAGPTPERSLAAQIAVNTSWARTANRAERTAPARRATPVQLDYWIDRIRTDHPTLPKQQQLQMADAAWRAQQQRNSLAAAKARRARAGRDRPAA